MSPKHPFLPPRDPGPSTPTPGAVQEEIETWRRWYPIGEPGAPCVACAPALEPGTENRPRHPHPPFPSGMLILVQEFPELPRVPRPSQPWRVTSAAGHLVVITHRGRGLWGPSPSSLLRLWAAGPCLPKGPSCSWLSFPVETFSQSLRPLDASGCGNCAGLGKMDCPCPQLEPHPPKPSGDPICRMLDLCGVWAGEDRGQIYQQLRGPLIVQT